MYIMFFFANLQYGHSIAEKASMSGICSRYNKGKRKTEKYGGEVGEVTESRFSK